MATKQRLWHLVLVGFVVAFSVTFLGLVAWAVTTTEGSDGTEGQAGNATLDNTTLKGWCSESARGPVINLPGGSVLTANLCSTSTISATDIGTTTPGPGVIPVTPASGKLDDWITSHAIGCGAGTRCEQRTGTGTDTGTGTVTSIDPTKSPTIYGVATATGTFVAGPGYTIIEKTGTGTSTTTGTRTATSVATTSTWWLSDTRTGVMTGTGTTNYLPKRLADGTYGDSPFFVTSASQVSMHTEAAGAQPVRLFLGNSSNDAASWSSFMLRTGSSGESGFEFYKYNTAGGLGVGLNNYDNGPLFFGTTNSIREVIGKAGGHAFGGNFDPNFPIDMYSTSADYSPIAMRSNLHVAGNKSCLRWGDYTQATAYMKGAICYEASNAYVVGKLHFALNNATDSSNASLSDDRFVITPAGVEVVGAEKFWGATSGSFTLRAPAIAGDVTMEGPSNNGTEGQYLRKGAGNATAWTTITPASIGALAADGATGSGNNVTVSAGKVTAVSTTSYLAPNGVSGTGSKTTYVNGQATSIGSINAGDITNAGGTVCAGTCSPSTGAAFASATGLTNAPVTYSGNNATVIGHLSSGGNVTGNNIDSAGNTTGAAALSVPKSHGYNLRGITAAGTTGCTASNTAWVTCSSVGATYSAADGSVDVTGVATVQASAGAMCAFRLYDSTTSTQISMSYNSVVSPYQQSSASLATATSIAYALISGGTTHVIQLQMIGVGEGAGCNVQSGGASLIVRTYGSL